VNRDRTQERNECNTILVIYFVVIAWQPLVLLIYWRSCVLRSWGVCNLVNNVFTACMSRLYHKSMSPRHFQCVRATLLRVAQPWLHSDPGMLDVVMVGKGETICELRSCGDPQFSAPLVIAEHPFASRSTNFNFFLIFSLQLTFPTAHQGSQLSLVRFRAAFSSKNVYFCQGGMSIMTGKDRAAQRAPKSQRSTDQLYATKR